MSGILGGAGGWFDQVGNFCTSAGRCVGLGGFYDSYMIPVANNYIKQVNDTAYDEAIKLGKSPIQALSAANVKLDAYSDPKSFHDLGSLLSSGISIAKDSTNQAAHGNPVEGLTPLLIGAGVLGAGYVVASAFADSTATSAPTSRNQRKARI